MLGRYSRAAIACGLLLAASARGVVAQTTVVQGPDGARTTMTIQSDGSTSANTIMIVQAPGDGQAGAPGALAPPPNGAVQFNSVQLGAGDVTTGLTIGAQTAGGVIGGATQAGPAPFPPRDQAPAVGTSRIQGRIVAADTGRPLRRAIVRLSAPGIREQRTATTDRDGRYEFIDLPAASYNLTATRSGFVSLGYKQTRPNTAPQPLVVGDRQTLDRIDFALPPGGVITGRVVDEFGEPVSDAFVMAMRQQYVNGVRRPMPTGSSSSANDIGEFRIFGLAPGDYYVSVNPRPAPGGPFEITSDRSGYAPTFYPSTSDIAAAQRLTVRAGETVANIVVSLTPARMARVTGMVLDAQGQPVKNGIVMATPAGGIMGMSTSPGMIRPDGTFTMNSLAPGDYVLRTTPNGVNLGGSSAPVVATASVSVNGVDLTNVVLQPQSPLVMHGRLTGDSATLAQVKPASTRLMAAPAGPPSFPAGPTGPPQPLRDDLSFDLSVYPGEYMIRPLQLQGMVIRSVRLNGRDVTRGFQLSAGAAVDDLEVEVTATTGRLMVTATNARNEAVPSRDVVVFPQDESQWGMPMPGHGSAGRTNEQGQYRRSCYRVRTTWRLPKEWRTDSRPIPSSSRRSAPRLSG